MSFKLYMENWDVHGSSATPEDEVYAQKTLLDAMRRVVKNFDRMSDGSPNVGYKTNPIPGSGEGLLSQCRAEDGERDSVL
jgi:hypothetical protein